jgi:hypothetical protein
MGRPPANPRSVSFPIAESLAKYSDLRDKSVRGARPEALRAIDALKPYRGGNDGFFQLHQLGIIDKHRMLLTVGAAFSSMDIGAHMMMTSK